jgi:hypothetical protein
MSEQTLQDGMSEQTLQERMEARKANYLLRLDTHIDMFNQSLSRNAPVLSQMVSAATVGYAIYEGVAKWLNAPFWGAVAIGVIAAGAIETVGFMSVDERDRADAHNRQHANPALHLDTSKSHYYVDATFWITMAIVATIETLPAIVGAIMGTTGTGDLLFRMALLLFPLLSRLGANLYAHRSVRIAIEQRIADDVKRLQTKSDQVEDEDREFARLERQAKLDAYKAQQEQELRIREQAELARIEAEKQATIAEAAAKAEAIRLNAEARVERAKSAKKPASESETKKPEIGKQMETEPKSQMETEYELMKRMITIYQREPSASNRKVADEIGVSHTTVSDLLSNLASKEVVHVEKIGRGKTVTVNGKLSAFMAGEL